MNLKDYFSETAGLGILSTADSSGVVNSAVYASPHFLGDGELSFIMRDRLTRANLQSNPNANYLFVNRSDGLNGLRINLHMVSESDDQKRIAELNRRKKGENEKDEYKYLVSFKVKKILQLLGGDDHTDNYTVT